MHAEELVLVVALIILVVALWRPVKRALLGALDSRAETIRRELDDAQRLHEEAKALLARYQRQLSTAIKRARFLALLPYCDNH